MNEKERNDYKREYNKEVYKTVKVYIRPAAKPSRPDTHIQSLNTKERYLAQYKHGELPNVFKVNNYQQDRQKYLHHGHINEHTNDTHAALYTGK